MIAPILLHPRPSQLQMNCTPLRIIFLPALAIAAMTILPSCTVDQEAALETSGSATKKEKTAEVKTSWAERQAAAKAEREDARAEAAKEKEAALAAKKREEEKAAKIAAAEKAQQEAEKAKLAEEREAKKAAEKKAWEDKIAAQKKEREDARAAKIAAREKAKAEREARDAAGNSSQEVPAVAERRDRGGFFSSLAVSTPSRYKSKGHYVNINNALLPSLNASNAKIEISLGEQRARIYKNTGGIKQLVIETQISSGKSGHTTPTGSFRIKEKLEHKRSTLYGRWVNSSGQTVQSSGDSRSRPSGGSSFIGAEMPYWMRITGGIGMHIGYVPNGPASHGCIRVPSAVQPLIFSKVGVGTPVTITY